MEFGAAWGFWVAAGGMTLGVVAVMALAIAGRRAGDEEPPEAFDLRVYRDQLREVEKDLARGVIGPDEADRLRAEVSRRILEADRALAAVRAGGAATGPGLRVMAALVALAVAGGTFLLYRDLGAPGYPDLPLQARIAASDDLRATRPAQADAQAQLPPSPAPDVAPEFLALMDQLRATLAERPGDLQGHQLLARNEANLGNHAAAWAAQSRVIEIQGPAAPAEDYAVLAELMVIAAGGYVSPEAEAALRAALERDPRNGLARYYWGLMLLQVGRADQAFPIWRALLEGSAPTDPWVPFVRERIGDVAYMAGVDYTPPPATAAPGPTEADIAAAGAMSPADRMEMIRGMVDNLGAKLAAEGGTAEEWARMIRSLGVLGETDRARAIWTEAQANFAGRDADLVIILMAAQMAGVAE
ncbi:MAG TPA: c-type cytochrome biogenesis protein CcmI [Paracoccaceae bacterium]|nr:c-type cytochrome biogenesis protein CcmI [Paracoccaceae bacterium]